jgi:hypothetical protein
MIQWQLSGGKAWQTFDGKAGSWPRIKHGSSRIRNRDDIWIKIINRCLGQEERFRQQQSISARVAGEWGKDHQKATAPSYKTSTNCCKTKSCLHSVASPKLNTRNSVKYEVPRTLPQASCLFSILNKTNFVSRSQTFFLKAKAISKAVLVNLISNVGNA